MCYYRTMEPLSLIDFRYFLRSDLSIHNTLSLLMTAMSYLYPSPDSGLFVVLFTNVQEHMEGDMKRHHMFTRRMEGCCRYQISP